MYQMIQIDMGSKSLAHGEPSRAASTVSVRDVCHDE